MKAAEYLESRGWVCVDVDDNGDASSWVDSTMPSVVPADGGGNLKITVGTSDALTIQRARDEEKCREAWVAFAAACLSHGYGFGDADPRAAGHESYYDPPGAATCADSLLREYRSRFCPEVES